MESQAYIVAKVKQLSGHLDIFDSCFLDLCPKGRWPLVYALEQVDSKLSVRLDDGLRRVKTKYLKEEKHAMETPSWQVGSTLCKRA